MKHVAIAFVLAFVASLGAGGSVHAQSVQELAKRAASDAKRGKDLEAYNTIRNAALRIWEQSPLLFREALFVKSAPTGYGIYDPRPNNVFKPGEKLFIYVEPVGADLTNRASRNSSGPRSQILSAALRIVL